MDNSSIVAYKESNHIAAAAPKKPPIKEIANQLKIMVILGKSVASILGTSYTMASGDSDYSGGNYSYLI